MVTGPTHLFLPYLKAVEVDVILNVLKRALESIHTLRECLQLGFKLTGLYERSVGMILMCLDIENTNIY